MAPPKKQTTKTPVGHDETPESETPEERFDVHWIPGPRDDLKQQPSLDQFLQNVEQNTEECHEQLTSLWEMILTARTDHHESQSRIERLETRLQSLEQERDTLQERLSQAA